MSNSSSETVYAVRRIMNVAVFAGICLMVSCNYTPFELTNSPQALPTPTVLVSNSPGDKDELAQRAARLTELYENRDCKAFFMAFPATFKELVQLYGFDDKTGGRILFSKYPEHFPYFFMCSKVTDREKLDKVIRIGIGGKYGDGVPIDMFHDPIFELIRRNPLEAKKILEGLPNKEAASFWYFLFDVPHPADKENSKKVELLRNILGKNSKQAKLLTEQYKKLLDDWREH